MSRLTAKAVVSVRVEAGTSLHFTSPVVQEVLIDEGLWYLLGDGTSLDLLSHIEDQVHAANAALSAFTLTLDQATGIITFSTPGASHSITWFTGVGGSGLDIRDFLRFERYNGGAFVTTTPITPVVGYRAGVGAYHCTNYLLEDLEEWEDYSAQMIPDDPNANPSGIKIARRRFSNITYQSEGFPRDTSVEFNEYHELVSFFEEAGSYRPFRVYYDRDVVDTPYATDNRLGYQVYVITRASTSQRPTPVTADYYLQFKQSFRAAEYNEEVEVAVPGLVSYLTWAALDAVLSVAAAGSYAVLDSGNGTIGLFESRGGGIIRLCGDLFLNLADGSEFTLGVSASDINYVTAAGTAPTWDTPNADPSAGGGLIAVDTAVDLSFLGVYSQIGVLGITATVWPTITTPIVGAQLCGIGWSRGSDTDSILASMTYEAGFWRLIYTYGPPTAALLTFFASAIKAAVTGQEMVMGCQTALGLGNTALPELSWNLSAYTGDGVGVDAQVVSANTGVGNASGILDTFVPCLVTNQLGGGDVSCRYSKISINENVRAAGMTP